MVIKEKDNWDKRPKEPLSAIGWQRTRPHVTESERPAGSCHHRVSRLARSPLLSSAFCITTGVFPTREDTNIRAETRPFSTMPSASRHSRQSLSGSPPLSTPTYSVSHATAIGTQKLNIVSRVVIEGSAERGANGAAIKMYMRVSSLFVFTAP